MATETGEQLFEAFINDYDDAAWHDVVSKLLPRIHEVDQNATQIWFYMFPLALLRALRQSEDVDSLALKLQLQGRYRLEDQIDSSHWFLYGHRYWSQVKPAIMQHAGARGRLDSLDLADQIAGVAETVARPLKADPSLLTGITAAGFMTLQQTGWSAFKAAPGLTGETLKGSPEQILARRRRDDSQWPFGFLRGFARRYSVTFDERSGESKFRLINSQHLTTAAAQDHRDYNSGDSRCIVGEGPIPVECRSASCGTCWVGIIAGREKLSEVAPLEARRIKEFGYINSDESHPLIRLSCQAQASGNVTIVIPPWNGVFGRHVARASSVEEENSAAAG
jgi:ferredoxin